MAQQDTRDFKIILSSTIASDGTGTVEITLGSEGYYYLEKMTVSLSQTPPIWKQAVARTYRGTVSQDNFNELTRSPEGDSSSTSMRLRGSDVITATWEKCVAGSRCTLKLEGQYSEKGV